jgi:hypothetical protein
VRYATGSRPVASPVPLARYDFPSPIIPMRRRVLRRKLACCTSRTFDSILELFCPCRQIVMGKLCDAKEHSLRCASNNDRLHLLCRGHEGGHRVRSAHDNSTPGNGAHKFKQLPGFWDVRSSVLGAESCRHLLFGSSDLNSTCFGTLYCVNCVPAKLMMSCAVDSFGGFRIGDTDRSTFQDSRMAGDHLFDFVWILLWPKTVHDISPCRKGVFAVLFDLLSLSGRPNAAWRERTHGEQHEARAVSKSD